MSDDDLDRFIIINFDIPEIRSALTIAHSYGQIDGAHHKSWVIDQMVRALIKDDVLYDTFIKTYKSGEDGPETYSWDEGIPP